MRRLILIALAALSLAGCGSSSSPKPATTASDPSCTTAIGTASGKALVRDTPAGVKYYVASGFAEGFRVWASGHAAQGNPGSPTKPLCATARAAAAKVAIAYAEAHAGLFARDSKAQDGGSNLVAYLQAHGVR